MASSARKILLFAMLFAWAVPVAAGPGPGSDAEGARGSIERLAWLAGCWESRSGARTIEEQWTAPAGGTMLGMSRTVAAGETAEFEFLRIVEREGGLAYAASPSGRSATFFDAVEIGDSLVVFEYPSHDFPTRIRYRLLPGGDLLARIEGTAGGEARAIDFPMARVDCPGGDPCGGSAGGPDGGSNGGPSAPSAGAK